MPNKEWSFYVDRLFLPTLMGNLLLVSVWVWTFDCKSNFYKQIIWRALHSLNLNQIILVRNHKMSEWINREIKAQRLEMLNNSKLQEVLLQRSTISRTSRFLVQSKLRESFFLQILIFFGFGFMNSWYWMFLPKISTEEKWFSPFWLCFVVIKT